MPAASRGVLVTCDGGWEDRASDEAVSLIEEVGAMSHRGGGYDEYMHLWTLVNKDNLKRPTGAWHLRTVSDLPSY